MADFCFVFTGDTPMTHNNKVLQNYELVAPLADVKYHMKIFKR
jgi:hypothetical protein